MGIYRALTNAASGDAFVKDSPWYLAGKMTGVPQFNFPLFFRAADQLRKRHKVNIVSPAEIDDPATREAALASPDGAPGSGVANDETYGDFMARDVKIVIDQAAGVIVLPYWYESTGATIEVFTALRLNPPKPVFYYDPDLDKLGHRIDLQRLFEALALASADKPVELFAPDPIPDREPYVEGGKFLRPANPEPDEAESYVGHYVTGTAADIEPEPAKTIAQEADELIAGARQSQYGHPIEDFTRTAGAINAMFGTELGPMDVPQLMILLKLSRIRQTPFKRDSWVDIDGYAGTAEMVAEKLGTPLE
jgi:hypothetical protein